MDSSQEILELLREIRAEQVEAKRERREIKAMLAKRVRKSAEGEIDPEAVMAGILVSNDITEPTEIARILGIHRSDIYNKKKFALVLKKIYEIRGKKGKS